MESLVDFGETYLYKLRALSAILERLFDQALRDYAQITLSQCMVLIAISQSEGINQRKVARYLGISAVAVKRQVDIAKRRCWVEVVSRDARGDRLRLTSQGSAAVEAGLRALEQHVFKVFDGHNRSANLMQHLDLLLSGAKEVLNEKQTSRH